MFGEREHACVNSKVYLARHAREPCCWTRIDIHLAHRRLGAGRDETNLLLVSSALRVCVHSVYLHQLGEKSFPRECKVFLHRNMSITLFGLRPTRHEVGRLTHHGPQ